MPGRRRDVGFGNLDLNRRGAGGRVENRRDAGDPAEEVLAGKRIHRDVRGIAILQLPQILLDDVGDQPDDADVDHLDDRRLLTDERAWIDSALGDEAGDGRGDEGVAQRDLQLFEAGLGL